MPTTWTQSGPVNVDADLLWSAAVKDETGVFFRNFDRNVDELTRRSKKSLDGVETGSRKSGAAIGILAGAVGGLTMQLVNMGMAAVRQFTQIAKSAVGVAARAKTLAVALNTVGANAGYSQEEMAKFEDAMKSNGITTIKTREALLKMTQANLDLTKAQELSRVAQDAAVIAGTNSSEAFGRIIHGITTLNPLTLRNAGIVINAQVEYKKWAAANNTTAAAMDYTTKQQILMNAVLAAGSRIAGTYASAMGTAGKQSASLARHQEELLLAIGNVAQPVYMEWIQFMTRELKELREWFAENEEGLQDLAQIMGFAAEKALGLVSALMDLFQMEQPGGLVRELPIFQILEMLPDIDERWKNLGATARQFFALAATGWTVIMTLLIEYGGALVTTANSLVSYAKSVEALINLDFEGQQKHAIDSMLLFNEAVGQAGGAFEKARAAGAETMIEWSTGLALIESGAEDAADAIETLTDNTAALEEEAKGVIAAIEELNEKIGKELAEIAKRQARKDIENAIREARKREDIARRHAERIEGIMSSADDDRKEVLADTADDERELLEEQAQERSEMMRDNARDMLDIETDYRRRLEDIARRFDADASEAARSNDAVTMARLMRQNKRNLEEAKISRDRDITDTKTDHEQSLVDLQESQKMQRKEIRKDAAERMENLEKDLKDRLDAAEVSRQKDLENLARSLAREKEDRARQRAWEEQDRREKYEAELEAMGKHFAELQFIDATGLQLLLQNHGEFIEKDMALWAAYYEARDTRAARSRPDAWTGPVDTTIGGPAGEYGGGKGSPFSEWGFARGGMGLAMSPQTIRIGEEPEVVAALPLSRMASSHSFQFSDWNVNVNGVSPQAESELIPAMMGMMQQLAQMMKSSMSGGGNLGYRA